MKSELEILKYICTEGLNKVDVEINIKTKSFEIFRWAVKDENFIKKVNEFANSILKDKIK